MPLPWMRFTLKGMSIAVAAAAIMILLIRDTWRTAIPSTPEAIRIATARIARVDSNFLPEEHMARVYRTCGRSPLEVDFYKADWAYVVGR